MSPSSPFRSLVYCVISGYILMISGYIFLHVKSLPWKVSSRPNVIDMSNRHRQSRNLIVPELERFLLVYWHLQLDSTKPDLRYQSLPFFYGPIGVETLQGSLFVYIRRIPFVCTLLRMEDWKSSTHPLPVHHRVCMVRYQTITHTETMTSDWRKLKGG